MDWRNPVDALDVNGDREIAPDDALQVINRLNSSVESSLPAAYVGSAYVDVDGDQKLSPEDALEVINAINQGLMGARTLTNGASDAEGQVTLTVGQSQGVRTYRLRIEAEFDAGATATDRLVVHLVDPASPARTLLDRGQPGSALFELSPAGAVFSSDFAQWDGTILTIALPDFTAHDTGWLRLRMFSGEGITGNRISVTPLTNEVNPAVAWPPYATQTLALTAHLSPDSDPDGNNIVLKSSISIGGQTAPGAEVELTGAGSLALQTTANAQGHYEFAVEAPPGFNEFQIEAEDGAGREATTRLTVRHGDVVLDWNAAMLTVVRDFNTLSNDPYPNRVVLSPPPVVTRNLAIVHAAIYDAINSVERKYQPYHVDLVAPAGTSAVAAAATAAQRVASKLYTTIDEQAIFNAAMIEALSTVPEGPGKTQGIALGQQVGDAIWAWRQNDGARAVIPYTPGTLPGQWQRTFPDYFPPLVPQWPKVTPFAMTSPSQFRAPQPPALDSAEYTAAVDEVQRLGGYTSTERTAEQTEIALFWADGGGTWTPAGHWNQIAADVALDQELPLAEMARLFAMLNVAEGDAGISCWDSKYYYGYWRPIESIRKADIDGNDATIADPNWIPLIRTPNFPSYTSGHSTFTSAAATILNHVFGTNVAFNSTADDHTGFRERPLADHQVVTRNFTSFDQAATEAGMSRIYGGIHYQFDNTEGKVAGRAISNWVIANYFQPADVEDD